MRFKILRYLRRHFIDAPRGFGHPVPAEAFDAEFRSGHWRLLDSDDEHARYAALATLIRSRVPHPKLLDAGCGSGRLATCFDSDELACYHGVDLSAEALRQARASAPIGAALFQADLESWTPLERYDVIVINEVIGYFYDSTVTLARLAQALKPGGILVVSLYRWGNALAIWRRLDTGFTTVWSTVVTNSGGDKAWDIRIVLPLSPGTPSSA